MQRRRIPSRNMPIFSRVRTERIIFQIAKGLDSEYRRLRQGMADDTSRGFGHDALAPVLFGQNVADLRSMPVKLDFDHAQQLARGALM